ncbi:reverse transcriptase domain-containing protein [Tanacetum coccineum]
MPEESRIPISLGRPFLAIARAMIDVFNRKITLRVGDDELIFDVDQSIKRPPTEDDDCYGIDDLYEMINVETHELLRNDQLDSFLLKGLEKSINRANLESCDFIGNESVKSEHLYSASANEIDEKKPGLKDLPHHLEYAYLHDDKSFPIIISPKLSEKEKMLLLQITYRLENPDLGVFIEEEIADEFPDEHLIMLKAKPNDDEPWLCPDNIMRRCVVGSEILEILAHCHSVTTGGHHSASITRRKVYESGFFWPSIFKDAKDYVMRCDTCQRSGNISSRSEMPQNNIQIGYEKACHLPVEIEHKAYWALKQCNMDLAAAAKNRFIELNELIELRDRAYENTRI